MHKSWIELLGSTPLDKSTKIFLSSFRRNNLTQTNRSVRLTQGPLFFNHTQSCSTIYICMFLAHNDVCGRWFAANFADVCKLMVEYDRWIFRLTLHAFNKSKFTISFCEYFFQAAGLYCGGSDKDFSDSYLVEYLEKILRIWWMLSLKL